MCGAELKDNGVECAAQRHSRPVEAEVGKEEPVSFQSVLYLWFLQASTLSKGVLSPGASWVSHDRRADRDREIHTERKKSRKKTVAESSRQTDRQTEAADFLHIPSGKQTSILFQPC